MAETTSSAVPGKLYRYSDTATRIDHALLAESARLASVLYHFESTCTEYRVHASYLADEVRAYARRHEDTDRWVREVGKEFERADQRSWLEFLWRCLTATGLASSIPSFAWLLILLNRYLDKTPELRPGGPLSLQARLVLDDLLEDHAFPYFGLGLAALGQLGITNFRSGWEVFKEGHEIVEKIGEMRQILRGLRVEAGTTYPGQIKFYGPHRLKEMIGWSSHLTHMSGTLVNLGQLSLQTGWHTFRETIIPSSTLGRGVWVVSIAISGYQNWHKYKDEGLGKVAIGTAIDSALSIGFAAAGGAVGATAGAFLGGLVGGPVGLAIGGKIGGVAGSLAGGWVAEKIKQTDFDENLTDLIAGKTKPSKQSSLKPTESTESARELEISGALEPVQPIKIRTPFISQWDREAGNGNNNCGPASITMAMKAFGKDIEYQTVVNSMRSSNNPNGYTTFPDAEAILKEHGLQQYKVADMETMRDELDDGHPVIVQVESKHYIRNEEGRSVPYGVENTGGYTEGAHIVMVAGYDLDEFGRLQNVYINDPLAVKTVEENGIPFVVADEETGKGFRVPYDDFVKATNGMNNAISVQPQSI